MNILEKEIEDVVFQSPNELLRQKGLPIYGRKVRQLNLGSYGIADIVAVRFEKYDCINIHLQVIELKKELIDVNTLMQCARYAQAIKRFLINERNVSHHKIKVECILIGKEIQASGDFVYLSDLFDVHCYEYKIDLMDGISFIRKNGYYLTSEIFPESLDNVCNAFLVTLKNQFRENG